MQKTIYTMLGLTAIMSLVPRITLAQSCVGSNPICQLLATVGEIIDASIFIVSSLALLVFIWGLVKYIWSQGTDGKVEGKKIMVWGVVALFVLFSVFGLVRFMREAFGIERNAGLPPPTVDLPR